MPKTHKTLPPDSRIDGKYAIVRRIGKGGMGSVYEAIQLSTGRKVAIKVLRTRFCHVSEVASRFLREAQLAASIGHKNICEVIDSGTHESGAPYLVMPMLEGQSLYGLMKSGALSGSEDKVSKIICQTLSALAAAHDAGIVHRDLKPDNIFVTSGGDGEDFVKLLDFGVSKMLSPKSGSVYTKEGTLLGTPAYMAPEQAKGRKSIDHRIDIYAMGVILYEIMTGQKPYRGDSPKETVFEIITKPFLSPGRINPTITEEMEKVIHKAMAKDPRARFGSALEMQKAFRQAQGIPSIPPVRGTSAPTAVSESTHSFTPAAHEHTGSATPSHGRERGEEETIPTPRSLARRKALIFAFFGVAALLLVAAIFWVTSREKKATPIVVPLFAPTQQQEAGSLNHQNKPVEPPTQH